MSMMSQVMYTYFNEILENYVEIFVKRLELRQPDYFLDNGENYTFFSLNENGNLGPFDEETKYMNTVTIPNPELSSFENFFL